MGLSATQARYLMLVGRQSDLEYQGQQINNERTVLSQQVSDLYNNLLEMEVPTPPSTSNYTTVSYSCENGTTEYTFDANSVKPSGDKYMVTLSRTAYGHNMTMNDGYKTVTYLSEDVEIPTTAVSTGSTGTTLTTNVTTTTLTNDSTTSTTIETPKTRTIITGSAGTTITTETTPPSTIQVSANTTTTVTVRTTKTTLKAGASAQVTTGTTEYVVPASTETTITTGTTTITADSYMIAGQYGAYTLDKDNIAISILGYSSAYNDLSEAEQAKVDELYEGYKQAIEHAQICNSNGKAVDIENDDGTPNYYFYVDDSKKVHFSLATDITDVDSDTGKGTAVTYDYVSNGKYKEIEEKDGCDLTFDVSTGRMTHITIPVYNEDGEITGGTTLALTATTTTDEAAYKDAYAQYEYKKYLYDKEQNEINAKTEVIQQEDKNLELKLQRLDTERQEITNEVEALEKVMQENIESSYKTFSG